MMTMMAVVEYFQDDIDERSLNEIIFNNPMMSRSPQ
jgi:hypothetical protein